MSTTLEAPVASPDETSPRPAGLRSQWVALFALCLAFFVEMVDNTVLTIALPTIGRDLHAGPTGLQWVTGAYSLTFGGLLLTGGALADRFGRRRILMIGLTLFGLFSLPVWFVTGIGQLVAIRAALGVAAACMAPVTISLVFRLFHDEALRMRAINIMVLVGMGSFAAGPVLAGSALAHIRWEWLLLVNVPVALVAALGVHFCIAKDDPSELHVAPIDVPGIITTVATMALLSYFFTSGVERGWGSPVTLAVAAGAVLAAVGFVVRERTAKDPMLDLAVLTHRTVRGAAITQLAGNLAMVGIMFGLAMHFQYAMGWSALKAGLANLPFVLTMLAATPVAEAAAARLGHRLACIMSSVVMVAGLLGLSWSVSHGFWPVAASIVLMTLGLRVVMSICAIALVEAMPENRTSIGAALNDTAQEVGSSIGVAMIGTVIAVVAGKVLPEGVWSARMVHTFFHAEHVAYLLMAAVVAVVAAWGCSTLTDSRTAEEAH